MAIYDGINIFGSSQSMRYGGQTVMDNNKAFYNRSTTGENIIMATGSPPNVFNVIDARYKVGASGGWNFPGG